MFRPIYEPRTRAREYCDLALNIYTECPHGCYYCYAKSMAKRFGNPWTGEVKPRENIIEATKKQLATGRYKGKKIMLCFTCDPYPKGFDCSPTSEIIKLIKNAGAYVQILTKGNVLRATNDFSLLDSNDSFGISLTGEDVNSVDTVADVLTKMMTLQLAKMNGIKTWVSVEPVLNAEKVLFYIEKTDFVDLWRIGKLNGRKSYIDWAKFGHGVEKLCQRLGRNYYIKEDLRKEMQKGVK